MYANPYVPRTRFCTVSHLLQVLGNPSPLSAASMSPHCPAGMLFSATVVHRYMDDMIKLTSLDLSSKVFVLPGGHFGNQDGRLEADDFHSLGFLTRLHAAEPQFLFCRRNCGIYRQDRTGQLFRGKTPHQLP